jgi:hypothetical protein
MRPLFGFLNLIYTFRRLLWTSDQSIAEVFTYTQHRKTRENCLQLVSSLRSQWLSDHDLRLKPIRHWNRQSACWSVLILRIVRMCWCWNDVWCKRCENVSKYHRWNQHSEYDRARGGLRDIAAFVPRAHSELSAPGARRPCNGCKRRLHLQIK